MRSLLLLFVLTLQAGAQCPGGVCPAYSWLTFDDHPGVLHLYRGVEQVGAFDIASGTYRRLLDYAGGVWDEPGTPAEPLPAGYLRKRELNFGVDRSKLKQDARYRLNGREISRDEAHRVLESVPDDAGKLRLTIIGSERERQPVLEELAAAENAELRSLVNVWAVPPEHWSLKDNTGTPAFVTTGRPTIYLQAEDGKVLHRQDGFAAGDIGAIRKAVAGYDARRDPDLRRPAAAGTRVPLQLLLGGGLGVLAVLLVQHFRGASSNIDSALKG